MTKDFYTAVESRRSLYSISDEQIVSNEKIIEIVNRAVKHTPSAFNSQTGRVVILFGENHKELWNITLEKLRKKVSEEKFPKTNEKINSFAAGYGTILFFDEMKDVENLQEKYKSYADRISMWANHSSGMLQYIIWTSLELEGLGASLQHYNPLIDEDVKNRWNIPSSWRLVAQMPFGKKTGPAGNKEYKPLEERIKIFK